MPESLREVLLLPINRPELFEGRRSKLLQPPKGILLYGPPGTHDVVSLTVLPALPANALITLSSSSSSVSLTGTGKTMMAKAIAKEGKLAFISTPARARAPDYDECHACAHTNPGWLQTSILPPSSTNGMANRR